MNKIKVILVDDHNLVRDGLKSLMQSDSGISVIGESSSYNELIKLLEIEIPDVVLMDISMPDMNGIEITKILSLKYPSINVIVLSMYINEEYIMASIKAGARGYLPKNTTKSELLKAIYCIYENGEYYNEQIMKIIFKSYRSQIKAGPEENNESEKKLTRREEEILKLLLSGKPNKEIADELFISIRTVESHKNHLMNKLNLKTNIDLLKYAVKNKIMDI